MEQLQNRGNVVHGGRVRRALGFAALIVATFMGILDSTIVNIALPDIIVYFHTTLNNTAWITTIYIMALAVFMITASKLADQFGRKRLMLIGLALFGVGSALCGFSGSLMTLIILRLVQGVGGAIIAPVVMPMALELYSRSKMAMIASVVGAVTGLAAAGGPPLGGVLVQYGSWRSIFFVNVPFAVLAFVLILLCTRESYDQTVSKKVDVWGIALLSACIFLLSFALLKGNDYGWHTPLILGMFAGAAVTGILFFMVERRSRAPMVELHLFRERTFTMSSVCYMLTGFGLVASAVVFNFYLQNMRGYQPLDAASIVMFASLTVIVAMPLGSFISNRWDARLVNFLGVLLMGVGSLLLTQVGLHTARSVMVADMIVSGFGMGFACQTLVSSIKHLPPEKSGIGSGVVNAARQIGTCIGVALLVSMLDTNIAGAKTDIQSDAMRRIDRLTVSDSVKRVAKQDTRALFQASDTSGKSALRAKLERDVKAAMQAQAEQDAPALLQKAGNPQQAARLAGETVQKQAAQLQQTLRAVSDETGTRLSRAFHAVFLLSAVILIAASVCGFFSDRKEKVPEA